MLVHWILLYEAYNIFVPSGTLLVPSAVVQPPASPEKRQQSQSMISIEHIAYLD
jgi:hypothetical protein